jgi:hypothetical protein
MKNVLGFAGVLLAATTISVALAADPPAAPATGGVAAKRPLEVTLKELGFGDPEHLRFGFFASPSGEHVANINLVPRNEGHDWAMILDGHKGAEWKEVRPVDNPGPGKFGWPPSFVPTPVVFEDGSMIYWAHKADQRPRLVVAGRGAKEEVIAVKDEMREFIESAAVTPDGKHLSYVIRKFDSRFAVVRDGKEGPPSAKPARRVLLSPDGQSVAWIPADSQVVIFGDKTFGPYPEVESMAFSPDGKRLAIIINRDKRQVVVCDGKESPAFSSVGFEFSPDSSSLICVARMADEKAHVSLWDGKEIAWAQWHIDPVFSLDGKRLAWYADNGQIFVLDRDAKDAKPVAVVSGKDEVSLPVFSPDSKHVAYGIAKGPGDKAKWAVAVDGRLLKGEYDPMWNRPMEGPSSPGAIIPAPFFSPDGKHVFWVGARMRSLSTSDMAHFIMIDGQARPEHDQIWIPAGFAQYPKTLRYIVRDGNELRLVETPWPEDTTWEKAVKN